MSLSGNRVPKKMAPENRRPIFGGKTHDNGKTKRPVPPPNLLTADAARHGAA